MSNMPLIIEVINPQQCAYVGERFSVRMRMSCPDNKPPILIRAIEPQDHSLVEIDADLFEREITLQPGEEYICTVYIVFSRTGRIVDSPIRVVTGVDEGSSRLPVPLSGIQVMPSLRTEVQFDIESICAYDAVTKADITLQHIGITQFDNLRVRVGPANAVHAGVSEQIHPTFRPNTSIRFTTVIDAPEITLELDATAAGERVGPITVKLPVPPIRDDATAVPFRFLEAKKLTQATLKLNELDGDRKEIHFANGSFTVRGGGERYRVTITPAHPQTTSVKLRGVSKIVEINEMAADASTWPFQLVVTSSSVFTSSATLHFDVMTPEGLQQGELNLTIRPADAKLWKVAATLGAALTIKEASAIVSALARPGDMVETIREMVTGPNALFDIAQLLSIPAFRLFLGSLDWFYRQFEEG